MTHWIQTLKYQYTSAVEIMKILTFQKGFAEGGKENLRTCGTVSENNKKEKIK